MKTTFVSDLSCKPFPADEKVCGEALRPSVLELIREDNPEFDATKFLSLTELNRYRRKEICTYLGKEPESLCGLEKHVIEAIEKESPVSENPLEEEESVRFRDRFADRVAAIGGSWYFIVFFFFFLLVWMAVNTFWVFNRGFDPYPFVTLNLILSYVTALQAPLIMMSQNRHAAKDRQRAQEDYMVNLKSELEVRAMHEKLDHLMMHQQQELIEIQHRQIEMLDDLQKELKKQLKKAEGALSKE